VKSWVEAEVGAYAKSRRSTGVIGRDGSFREARAACSTAATLDRELRMSPSSIVAAITSHSFTGRAAPTRRTRYVDRRFAEQLKRRWARGDRPVTYTGTVGHTQQRGSRGAEDTRPGSPGRSISINGPRAAARDQECDKGLPHTHMMIIARRAQPVPAMASARRPAHRNPGGFSLRNVALLGLMLLATAPRIADGAYLPAGDPLPTLNNMHRIALRLGSGRSYWLRDTPSSKHEPFAAPQARTSSPARAQA
jgi:hypothetical protein